MASSVAADPRIPLLLDLAGRAATCALRHYQSQALEVATKADDSPVTAADREIEALLRGEIRRDFPNDGVLGEEHGELPSTSGWRWVIDPIDGTVSFATGVPLFGTLIALEHDGDVVAGICSMPALGERVWAVRDGGAWWDRTLADGSTMRTAARVRACPALAQALVCTSGLEYFERARATETLVAVARAAGRMRGWSDCYGGMLVATGRADGWIDPVMNPWDSGPFPVIMAEAGGVFSDFHGRPDIHGGSAIAGSAAVHAELLRIAQASASHAASNADA